MKRKLNRPRKPSPEPLKMHKVWVNEAVMVHGPGHLTDAESAKWVTIYRKINPSDKVYVENTYR